MGRNTDRSKVAYSWISPDPAKAGPTLSGGVVVVVSSSREPSTFPSQPKVNHKGHDSSSSGNPSEPVRKVNVVISLRFGREVDN